MFWRKLTRELITKPTRDVELLFVPDDGRPTLDLTPVCYNLGGLSWTYEVSREHTGHVVLYGSDVVPSGVGALRLTTRYGTEDWPVKVAGRAQADSLRVWRKNSLPPKWEYALTVLGPPRASVLDPT